MSVVQDLGSLACARQDHGQWVVSRVVSFWIFVGGEGFCRRSVSRQVYGSPKP